MRSRMLASVAPVVVLFVLTGPINTASAEPAPPGTVQIDGDRLTYVAAAGMLNDVRVTGGPSVVGDPVDFVVTDTAGLLAGAGCTQVRRIEVTCNASGVTSILLDGGDRPDELRSSSYVATTIYGGTGNDEIGSDGSTTYADGGLGDDFIGVGGRRSNTLLGSEGNDSLNGGGLSTDLIFGGPGADDISGSGRDDRIYGDEGPDTIVGGRGLDKLRGGPGDDSIDGQQGPDRITGSIGTDTLLGGPGDDFISTRAFYKPVDGRADSATCGKGDDAVAADGADVIAADCESVYLS
jgi:Ca2+-binding RTX toxin-like protein